MLVEPIASPEAYLQQARLALLRKTLRPPWTVDNILWGGVLERWRLVLNDGAGHYREFQFPFDLTLPLVEQQVVARLEREAAEEASELAEETEEREALVTALQKVPEAMCERLRVRLSGAFARAPLPNEITAVVVTEPEPLGGGGF